MHSNPYDCGLNQYPGIATWKCYSIISVKGVAAKARPQQTELEQYKYNYTLGKKR